MINQNIIEVNIYTNEFTEIIGIELITSSSAGFPNLYHLNSLEQRYKKHLEHNNELKTKFENEFSKMEKLANEILRNEFNFELNYRVIYYDHINRSTLNCEQLLLSNYTDNRNSLKESTKTAIYKKIGYGCREQKSRFF